MNSSTFGAADSEGVEEREGGGEARRGTEDIRDDEVDAGTQLIVSIDIWPSRMYTYLERRNLQLVLAQRKQVQVVS